MMIDLDSSDLDAATIEGVPDLRGTRLLCFGLAVPCFVFAVWLPITGWGRASETDHPDFVMFLILAAVSLAAGLAIGLIRAGMRPGAWFRVGPDGVDYGSGSEDRDIAHAAGDRIEWKRVVPNPERVFDIGTAPEVYRVAPVPRMTFWYREDNGLLVERTLPLQLRTDALRCLRFRNGHTVRVALLRQLAAKPGLRFDPEVFVKAGVDPETWQPMPGPGRALWIAVLLTIACLLGFAALGGGWSPGWLAIGAVLIFCGGLLTYMRYWPQAYPRLTGVIRFRARS